MKKNIFTLISNNSLLTLSSITSAVLTEFVVELFLDLFTTNEYSIIYHDQINKSIQIVQNSNGIGSFLLGILFVFIVYFILFLLSTTIISLLAYLSTNRFHRKKIYTKTQLVSSYNAIKKEIISLYSEYRNNETRLEERIILIGSFAAQINSLHKIFVADGSANPILVKKIFRNANSSDILRAGEYITPYEYIALLDLVESFMQEQLNTKYKDCIQNDIISIQNVIKELKDLTKH